MSEIAADLDLQTLGVVGLGLVLGFVIVWSILSARSVDRAGKKSGHAADGKDDLES
jgi:hypothetical protein